MVKAKVLELGLIRGRHEMPVSDYIFEEILNPLDFEDMYSTAYTKLKELRGTFEYKSIKTEDYPDTIGCFYGTLKLYATGLTSAIVSVASVCYELGLDLIVYHYNRDTELYEAQHMYSKFYN